MRGMGVRGLVAAAIVLAAVGGACDMEVPPSEGPSSARTEGNGFVLETSLPKLAWHPDEAIEIRTSLTYVGPAARATIWGSSFGTVQFGLEELGGRRSVGGVATADCVTFDYPRGVATVVPFAKTGGYSGDDPDAAFYKQFYADPQFHLPVGRWRLTVSISAFLAECAGNAPKLELKLAPIDLEVR